MDNKIRKLCDTANINEIKRIPGIKLPIKQMIIYLETKLDDYECKLSIDYSTEIYFLKLRVMECIMYLKKVQ